ncbi:hypothetical protein JW835_09895 [bacterium]|nr:hypothetical protein [bacterium]
MLSKIKFLIICIPGVSTLLFSGCYTSFSVFHAPSSISTGYVIEEFDEDEDFEVVVYNSWYDYVPIHRPPWVQYIYCDDPMVNVCVRWPDWYWYAYYDPWWNVSYHPTYWSVSWYHYGWAAYPYPSWHPAVFYSPYRYAWNSPRTWHQDHRMYHTPAGFTKRTFGYREHRIRQAPHLEKTGMASRSSTSRESVVRNQSRVSSGSRLNKSGTAGRTVHMDRNESYSTQKRPNRSSRVAMNQNTSRSDSNTNQRQGTSRLAASASPSVPNGTAEPSRNSNRRSTPTSRVLKTSNKRSSSSMQSVRKVQSSQSSQQPTSKSNAIQETRSVRKKVLQRSSVSVSKKTSSSTLQKRSSSQSSPVSNKNKLSKKSSPSSSEQKPNTSSAGSSSGNSKTSGAGNQKSRSVSRSTKRSSLTKKKSEKSSSSNRRR